MVDLDCEGLSLCGFGAEVMRDFVVITVEERSSGVLAVGEL